MWFDRVTGVKKINSLTRRKKVLTCEASEIKIIFNLLEILIDTL